MSSARLASFDALSFDCYGTLIDWEAGLTRGLAKVATLADDPIPVETLLESYAEAEAEIERSAPSTPYPDVIGRSAIVAGTAHGIAVPGALAREIGASVPEWPAFPDSPEALARLQRRHALIILSNVDRASFAGSNERLGVEFDAILTAQDIGSYKPHPRNFEALLARVAAMGIERSRLLHVAQSLFHDHVPAKAAGLSTVWIDRRFDKDGFGATPPPEIEVTPDWRFSSMAAFADAVDEAFALR